MNNSIPLAEQLRPTTIQEIVGQDHLTGKTGILTKFLQSHFLPSLVFWGPPGVGKTSIARVLAISFHAHFESKSAVTTNLSAIREVIDAAKQRLLQQKKTILFIDEIHRFNKAQQDALLPAVEDGTVIFIGATTENPSFEIISALLSRLRVITVKELDDQAMDTLITKGLAVLQTTIEDSAKAMVKEIANSDGRQLLTILEIAASIRGKEKSISVDDIAQATQSSVNRYDKDGEEHYNTISAFIKSMRAGQVNGALYYLARMVNSGEDALFIARRMVIFAAEDIGLAQPTALVVANSVFDAVHKVGYPEAQIILGYGVTYLTQAKKDRRAYDAYFAALDDVKKYGNLPIPLSSRNAPTKLMKDSGYGKGYEMYTENSFLPDKLKNKSYLK